MAAVCRHWRMTPEEYWRLSGEELDALIEHMREERKAQEAAARKRRRR